MNRKRWIILAGVVLAGLVTLYYFVNPSESRWMPRCMFHTITGWDCPGCGSQRMVHALLHGNLHEAWHHNAFLLLSLPVLTWLGWLELNYKKHPRLYTCLHSLPVMLAVCIVIVAWTIGRNIL